MNGNELSVFLDGYKYSLRSSLNFMVGIKWGQNFTILDEFESLEENLRNVEEYNTDEKLPGCRCGSNHHFQNVYDSTSNIPSGQSLTEQKWETELLKCFLDHKHNDRFLLL